MIQAKYTCGYNALIESVSGIAKSIQALKSG